MTDGAEAVSGEPDWPALAGRLTAEGHVLPVRVYYEDTDFSSFVYHASYFRFMERGRTDFLRLKGIGQRHLAEGEAGEGLAFVVRRMEAEFLLPALMDDVLEVATIAEAAEGARLRLRQDVRRKGQALCTAVVTVALVTSGGRPRRIPAEIRTLLFPGKVAAVTDP